MLMITFGPFSLCYFNLSFVSFYIQCTNSLQLKLNAHKPIFPFTVKIDPEVVLILETATMRSLQIQYQRYINLNH